MNKAFVVVMLAFSSMLFGCPDKAGDGAKATPSAPAAATPANAPAAPASAAAPKAGGGW